MLPKLYATCPDTLYLVFDSLDIMGVLSLSQCCKTTRDIIYKNPKRDIWRLRWEESCSKIVHYATAFEAIQYLYFMEKFNEITDLQTLLYNQHHNKEERRQINIINKIFQKGLEIPIIALMSKQKIGNEKLSSLILRAVPSGNKVLLCSLLEKTPNVTTEVRQLIIDLGDLDVIKKATAIDLRDFHYIPENAIKDERKDIFEVLFEHGYQKISQCISRAIHISKFRMADYFIGKFAEDLTGILREALLDAIYNQRITRIDYVLSKGYPINSRNGEALNRACHGKSTEVVNHLIKNGADIKLITKETLKDVGLQFLTFLYEIGLD